MVFLVDKYSPKTISDAYFHKDILAMLETMSKDESIPHIIFYGPYGSGKKTLIRLLLELLYDRHVTQTDDTLYTVVGSGNKPTEVMVKQSNYHIVIEPNNNNFDRYLIQDIVKEYAKRIPLNVYKVNRVFKTVLINNLDSMSYYAQTSLRRTMEKYSGTCRFVMWCRSLSQVIEPLISRCVCIRVDSPNNNELFGYLYNIAANEKINLQINDYHDIIRYANGNIKKAIWQLELIRNKLNKETIYEETINQIINKILLSDTYLINEIRTLNYNIMITNITGSNIINDLTQGLCSEQIPDTIKYRILEIAARYEHNIKKGRREMIHIEAFIMNVMRLIYIGKQKKPEKKIVVKK